MVQVNLSTLVIPSKEAEVDFPGYPDLSLKLCFLSREELVKLRKKAAKTKFDRKTRQPVEELDDELFLQLYVSSIIKGWNGLKLKYVAQLMPLDTSGFADMEAELEFSSDNALALMKNSPDFDSFVSETVSDLENFTRTSSK